MVIDKKSKSRRGGAHFSTNVSASAPTQKPAATHETLASDDVPYGGYGQRAINGYVHPTRSKRRRRSFVGPLIFVLLLAALGAGGWFAYERYLKPFDITVNGKSVTVDRDLTVEYLLNEGIVTPKAGRLLAIDNSVIDEAGGEPCKVTINGIAANLSSELVKDAVVEVSDGDDLVEDATVEEITVATERTGTEVTFESYYGGSLHLLADGQEGVIQKKTGVRSGITVEEEVTPAVDAKYLIYTAQPSEPVIALTFDDGPWPETTMAILDILEEYGAKATFFTIGNQVDDYSDAVVWANNMGCQVLTHTWDHADGSGGGTNIVAMSLEEQVEEVQKGYEAITNVIGSEPAHIFRAPGGNFYGEAVDNLWPYVDAEIGWNIDTEDWTLPGVEIIVEGILSAQPGDVVLMHDGGGNRWQTVEALREALPVLVERGYSFVTIEELLAYGMPEA